MPVFITAQELFHLASQAQAKCPDCLHCNCVSWEPMPTGFEKNNYPAIGSLEYEGSDQIWEEFHSENTYLWSENAPIATKYFPYNRCSVLQCHRCKTIYLTYTEYGGYYIEPRIRHVPPDLIVLE